MTTVVLVPYRADGGHRDRLWRHLRDNYWKRLPYRVIVGTHDSGPFNRSAAINYAARQVDWDIAVIADSDTWVPVHNLEAAIATAADTGQLTSALTAVAELDQHCTEEILDGHFDITALGIDRIRNGNLDTQSSILAVPRAMWDNIGGFDERFVGWGGEDNAFWRAATILAGHPQRIPGLAFHLWHLPASTAQERRASPEYQANLIRWKHYNNARTERMLRQAQWR